MGAHTRIKRFVWKYKCATCKDPVEVICQKKPVSKLCDYCRRKVIRDKQRLKYQKKEVSHENYS